jgi:hypothetical protein
MRVLLGVAALASAAVLGPTAWLATKPTSYRTCSIAPYALVQSFYQVRGDGELESFDGPVRLGPGECVTGEHVFGLDTPLIAVTSEVEASRSESDIFEFVANAVNDFPPVGDGPWDDLPSDPEIVRLVGDALACAETSSAMLEGFARIDGHCPNTGVQAGLTFGFLILDEETHSPLSNWAPSLGHWLQAKFGRHEFLFEQPGLQLDGAGAEGSYDDHLEAAAGDVQDLRESISRQISYDRQTPNGPRYLIADAYVDHNGPLVEGVWVDQTVTHDIWGRAHPLQPGDAITRFNYVRVRGEADVHQLLAQHAHVRTGGVERPVAIQGYRGFENISLHPYFYLDLDQFDENFNANAMAAGVADGWFPGLGGLGFEAKQRRARARQANERAYQNATWLGLFLPSPLMIAAEARLARGARGARSMQFAAHALRSAAINSAEVAVWAVVSPPPGTPLRERLDHAVKVIPLGAAFGVLGASGSERFQQAARRMR